MHRLFVGLRPPPDVTDALIDLMDDALAPDARWQSDAQLHLTLRFIGEVDRHLANAIAEALAALRHPAITLRLAPMGLFQRRGRVHTLYDGLAPNAALGALARKVARAVEDAGVPVDHRAFVAHVTLARFGNRGPAPEALAPLLARAAPPLDWRADALLLYRSQLGKGGSHYEVVGEWPLG